MNPFNSILVPLDGSRTSARSLGCATWLASQLEAKLHILSATRRESPPREALARLRVAEEFWPLITLHQAPAHPEDAIVAALTRYDIALIVMTARGATADTAQAAHAGPLKIVGHVTQAVIEASPVPVLLLPPAYVEALPWRRALVPLSGEAQADEALALAVRLADALDLSVHVAHVADSDGSEEGLTAAARYADAPHHEYPYRLEELVRRAVPGCTPEECRRIEDVALCRGDIAAELLGLIDRKRASLLVIGWHGRFMTGHAHVLKHLVEVVTCPLLLVKPAARMPFRLKVGEDIE
jgi:nucleotide-binding universal stress UspA family protein